LVVHALPSLQLVPFVAVGFEHCPVEGSQVPAEWHWSCALQETAVPPHVPFVHTSPVVQALPSEQLVPLVAFDQAVVLVAGWQLWQALDGFAVPAA